jgi:hypothetical protein
MYTIFFTILCRAVDIFQNLCWPIAIWAVNIFLSKSETAQNTRTADDFWFSSSWQKKWHLLKWCRAIIKSCRADFLSKRISSRWSWPLLLNHFICSTSDSEVVVVVSNVRKNHLTEKKSKNLGNIMRRKGHTNEDERVRQLILIVPFTSWFFKFFNQILYLY